MHRPLSYTYIGSQLFVGFCREEFRLEAPPIFAIFSRSSSFHVPKSRPLSFNLSSFMHLSFSAPLTNHQPRLPSLSISLSSFLQFWVISVFSVFHSFPHFNFTNSVFSFVPITFLIYQNLNFVLDYPSILLECKS